MPPGDAPWISFWREWTATAAVLLIVLGLVNELQREAVPLRLSLLSLPALAFALATVPWIQWLCGLEFYRGDALLVSLYLVGFGVCVLVSQWMSERGRDGLLDRLAFAMLGAGAVSAVLAVLQWTGQLHLEMNLPLTGGRPLAHMEQTNLLCSLLLQGVFGAWRLYERRRLGRAPALALALALLLAVDLTQSRVAWLVLVVAMASWALRVRSMDMRTRWPALAGALAVIAAGPVVVPILARHLGQDTLELSSRLTGGLRPAAWRLFVDAIHARPWAGWGAEQAGTAQYLLADRHPALHEFLISAHDIVLDLMVWFGAPIGLLAGGALVVATAAGLWRAGDSARLVTALAACALLLHGLVELPLHYTYFLFPLALMIGAGAAKPAPRASTRTMPAWSTAAVALPVTAVLALLARDYIPLSDYRPHMAYDKPSDHMVLTAPPPFTDTLIFDQLRAFQLFSEVPPRPGLDAATLESLRQPLLRFPFAVAQEHYAHIVALNGQPATAIDVLGRSCRFMQAIQCDGSHRAWEAWRDAGEPLPAWP
jgi:Virulence factor membrane-bound polymerase, C-terminal/O-Antigen ligase